MASGTINLTNSGTTSGGGYLAGYISWSSTADTANNKSTVTAKLYVKKAVTSGTISTATTGTWSHTLSIAGNSTSSSTYTSVSGSYVLMQTKTVTVSHDDDGDKSITISGSVSAPSGTTFAGKTTTGSKSVSLDTIARASIPTLSATSIKMGSALTITTNRKSDSFTHTLQYKFGSKSGTIATSVGASYQWTVPDLAAYCDDATSGTCTITCITYSGSTKVGTKTVTVTLTVPSATTPTFSATSVNMGSSVTITTARGSSNFTHTLSYSFEGATGTIATGVTTSKAWTVPYSLAAQIPSATSGTCTITCVTYNGTAKVGTTTAKVTLKVPNNSTTKPKISMSLSSLHSLGDTFAGLYIQGKCQVAAEITASSGYSTIESYKLAVGSVTKNGTSGAITSDTVSTYGSITVKSTVVDARGYSNEATQTIEVIPYTKPKVIPYSGEVDVVCARCLSDGTLADAGTYLRFKVGRKYSTVTSGGVQRNFCRLRYRYKVSTAGSYGSWNSLIAKSDTSTDQISVVKGGGAFDAKTSYTVQINAYDDIGHSHTLTFEIPTDEVAFHLKAGGKGAAFGKYSETDNLLEVASDWKFRAGGDAEVGGDLAVQGNTTVEGALGVTGNIETASNLSVGGNFLIGGSVVADYVIESGTYTLDNGSWRYKKWAGGTFDMSGAFDVLPTSSTAFSGGAAYYSNLISIPLPFSVNTLQAAGSTSAYYCWLLNAGISSSGATAMTFRLARFTAISTATTIPVRIIARGRWK